MAVSHDLIISLAKVKAIRVGMAILPGNRPIYILKIEFAHADVYNPPSSND